MSPIDLEDLRQQTVYSEKPEPDLPCYCLGSNRADCPLHGDAPDIPDGARVSQGYVF
jgi:hypothetical protein